MRKVVVNSTPIIALSKCGRLSLLREMYDEVVIPEAVYNEITAIDDVASRSLVGALDWIHVQKIKGSEDRRLYRTRLHDGEVEVMILAQEIHADVVIIDDYAARSTAGLLDLPLTGTIGVLIKAKKKKLIGEVMPIIAEMEEHHIYFSERLKEIVRKKTGE